MRYARDMLEGVKNQYHIVCDSIYRSNAISCLPKGKHIARQGAYYACNSYKSKIGLGDH